MEESERVGGGEGAHRQTSTPQTDGEPRAALGRVTARRAPRTDGEPSKQAQLMRGLVARRSQQHAAGTVRTRCRPVPAAQNYRRTHLDGADHVPHA